MPNNKINRGVSLDKKEWDLLRLIGKEQDATLHAISQYAIRYFLKQYSEGKIEFKKAVVLDKP